MRKTFNNKLVLRFRKWSRKAYAMFASIGKCVTIGCVKKGIADAALGKQANACTSPAEWSFLTDYTEKEEEDTGWEMETDVFLVNELCFEKNVTIERTLFLSSIISDQLCRMGVCEYSYPAFLLTLKN